MEAGSPAVRKELKGWWNTVVMTRRQPHTKVIIILTRWDPEDLAGIELEKNAARWTVLNLPALGEWVDDPRIRVAVDSGGTALWPEKYDKEWLETARDNMDRDEWLALYQQKPTRFGDEQTFDEGWLKDKLVDLNEEQIAEMNLYILGDPANRKKKERTDYTCIWVIAAHVDQNLYVLDGIYDRGLDQKDRWDALVKLHKKWNPISRIRSIGWEEFGLSADIEYFERKQNEGNYRFMITPLTSKIAKEDRIKSLVGLFRDGHIYFQRLIPGVIDGKHQNLTEYFLLNEYSRWPAVRHDDGLDNLSRIQDKEMNVDFPRKKDPKQDLFFTQRARRYQQASWMGR